MEQRKRFIDIAKAIGIFFVISSHSYAPLMAGVSACFISVFYIVSGYCTMRPIVPIEKLIKLMTPYVFFTITLFLVFQTFQPINFLGAIYSRSYLYPLTSDHNIGLMRSGNGPLWYLTSMFTSFCLYGIIQKCQQWKAIVILYVAVAYALSFLPILLPWSIDTAFITSTFIFAGTYLRKKDVLSQIRVWHFILLVLFYVLLWHLCGGVQLSVRVYGNSFFLFIPTAIIGSLIFIKSAQYMEQTWVGRVLVKIGQESLPIFCFHTPFITPCETIIEIIGVGMPPTVKGTLLVLLILVCTYPIAVIINRYILANLTNYLMNKSRNIR